MTVANWAPESGETRPDADTPTVRLPRQKGADEAPSVAPSVEPGVAPADEPARPSWLRRIRLVAFALIGAAVVLLLQPGAGDNPFGNLMEYRLRALEIVVVGVGVVAFFMAARRGRTWDADLIAVFSGMAAAYTVMMALAGTPYAFAGLAESDQAFRTQAVTRFADGWWSADYFYKGLHAYYAPVFPWVEGRTAALLGIEPWRMIKYGTVVGSFLAPLFSYALWRRLVSDRAAAIIAAVTLTTGFVAYEPYALVILVTIIPWWLQAVHGLVRDGIRPVRPWLLGVIGAVMFCTYYYYFLVCVLVFVIWLVVERRFGLTAAQVKRGIRVLVIAAAGASIFWLPLLYDIVTAEEYHPLNNRWFMAGFGDIILPMTEPSVLGVACLAGFVFLLATFRESLSRSLLIFLLADYLWHVLGYFLAAWNVPLMSFKMRELAPLILLAAAVLAVERATRFARERWDAGLVYRLTAAAAAVLCLVMVDSYVSVLMRHPLTKTAYATPLPDGTVPRFGVKYANGRPEPVSAEWLRTEIDSRYHGEGHPVVLTDRQDLYAFYPYYGFVEFNFTYSHPTAEFADRLEHLRAMAAAPDGYTFATLAFENRFDRIDAIVLHKEDDCLMFRYKADDFPNGHKDGKVCLPAALVQDTYFQITVVGEYVVAVRRPPGT